MIRLFIVVLILLIAIPAYAEPEIGSFDITYSEFKILPDPIAITFVNQYCESKKITVDEVKVTDVDKLIDT
ncbi:MAG: hypothetical protein NTY47_01495, partial [Candidatus Omnitrophica bacterium]|nr:hypothetical protein [Candidatus Omnitrophota bacterium]